MAKKNIETLAKEYGFLYACDYYGYILDSLTNGQRKQAADLYKAMKNENKTQFLTYYVFSYTGLEKLQDTISFFIKAELKQF